MPHFEALDPPWGPKSEVRETHIPIICEGDEDPQEVPEELKRLERLCLMAGRLTVPRACIQYAAGRQVGDESEARTSSAMTAICQHGDRLVWIARWVWTRDPVRFCPLVLVAARR